MNLTKEQIEELTTLVVETFTENEVAELRRLALIGLEAKARGWQHVPEGFVVVPKQREYICNKCFLRQEEGKPEDVLF